MATHKKKNAGGAAYFLARSKEEQREIDRVCLARLQELEAEQESARQHGDEEAVTKLGTEMAETKRRMCEPPPIWKEPLKARDEAFEAVLAFLALGKFWRIEPYYDPRQGDPKAPSRFPNAAKRVPLTPEEIQAAPNPEWGGFSQRTLDILERVKMMKPAAAFHFGFVVGLQAGEAQAREYGPAAGRADGAKGPPAAIARRPEAYIRKAVLSIARENGISTPSGLRTLLNTNPRLGFKCSGGAKTKWVFGDRNAPATKRGEGPVQWKIGQTGIHKLLKENSQPKDT